MDFDVVGQLTVNDDGTSTLQAANSELDEMQSQGNGLQSVLSGVAAGFTTAFVTTALSAISGASSALQSFIGDSLNAADRHDKALAQLNAALKSTGDTADAATQSGGHWATTTELSGKAATKLQGQIDKLSTSIANQNEKDSLMGKTSKATQVSLQMKGEQLGKLNAQLAAGTAAQKVWVDSAAAEAPVVNMTIDQLTALAAHMSTKTLFSQDQYVAAETYMVQMGKIGKDVFPQAMQATADLATRMGVDLPQAAQLVARAISQPESGIGRLNTQFKLFDAEQLKSVQYMAAHGQAAKAQTMILDALTKAVGGSAEAAAEAGLGPWQLLQNKWEDIQDQIGNALIPGIDAIGTAIGPVMDQVLPKLTSFLTNVMGPALTVVGTAVGNFITQIANGTKPLDALDSALAGAGVDPKTIQSINDFANGVANFVKGIPAFLKSVGDFVQNAVTFGQNVANIASGVQTAWNTLPTIFNGVVSQIKTSINTAGSAIGVVLGTAFNSALTSASNFISGFMTMGQVIISSIVLGINKETDQIGTNITTGVQAGVNAVGLLLSKFITQGNAIVDSIGAGIAAKVDDIKTGVNTAITGAAGKVDDVVKQFITMGENIIKGIVKGIVDNAGAVAKAVIDAAHGAISAGLKALGIGSPSKVFAEMGMNVMRGMRVGIQNGMGLPVSAIKTLGPAMVSSAIGSATSNDSHNSSINQYYFGSPTYQAQTSNAAQQLQLYRSS